LEFHGYRTEGRRIRISLQGNYLTVGVPQATLAEWINTSTHYIAMIELERKTPSLFMVERIASALQIDSPELFSVKKVPAVALRKLQATVLQDIEKAVSNIITDRLNELENCVECADKAIETP
jgi:DNA-binding XRE family transcriptional regulator